jgi:hypothetical protein
MLRKILCLAATALFTHAASADVLYTWQQVKHSPSTPDGLHLELLFTDAAIAQGSVDLNVENLCNYGNCEQQQDSLVSLRYWYAGADGEQQWNMIDYRYGDETLPGLQRLSLALDFLPGGRLSGTIDANNGFSDFSMASDGAFFTLLAAHSDEPDGCGFAYPSCAGERGMLRGSKPVRMHAQAQNQDQDQDQPLPEPAGLATLAIGALAGWAARRRRAA